MLKQSSEALWDGYDLAMLDLDGVVYIGPAAVPGAAAALQKALAAGMQLAYVTNNASRPPGVVADHLRDLGVPVEDGHVVTSAQAASRLLADELEPGSKVFVIGGRGLFEALLDEGLVPVQSTDDAPVAVASGYDADLRWRTVTEGAILVKQGLFWVASNMDLSVPTARGHGPGNGVLVEAVAGFADRRPVVAGKPLPPLFEETRRRVGGDRPLVVGDRLDTDIEGANNTGLDSLLVMTGVTGLPELASATPELRPSYVSADLDGLGCAHGVPAPAGEGFELGGWRARVHDGEFAVEGSGSTDDWWRVVAQTAWQHLDTTGGPAETSALRPPG